MVFMRTDKGVIVEVEDEYIKEKEKIGWKIIEVSKEILEEIKKGKLRSDEICNMLGGNYDYDDNTCDLEFDDEGLKRSILKGDLVLYFLLQIIIGSSIVVINTYYTVTLIPKYWISSLVILLFVFSFSLMILWYKLRSWKEAILRAIVALVTIAFFSMLIGWIYYWDFTLYLGFFQFLSSEPVASTISGLIVSSLLSVVLVKPEERDDSSNDMTWNIVK